MKHYEDSCGAEPYMIDHVAIKFKDEIFALPKPNRHHHVISLIYDKYEEPLTSSNSRQGFLYKGEFITRKKAAIIAKRIGQVKELKHDKLFSEDLW